jgi:hypothetical protein
MRGSGHVNTRIVPIRQLRDRHRWALEPHSEILYAHVDVSRLWRTLGLAVSVWLVGSPLRADGPWLHVRVDEGSCPSAQVLRDKLEPLIDDDAGELEVSSSGLLRAGVVQAFVRDLGTRYVVEVDGLRREIGDSARDCVERARVAAVFLALNAKPPPAKMRAGNATRGGLRLYGEGVYAIEVERASAGGALGLWLEHAWLRIDFSAGAQAPIQIPLSPLNGTRPSISLLRVPLRASASCQWEFGRIRVGPALGLALDVLRIRGEGAENPRTELRGNLGLVVAANLRVRLNDTWSLGLSIGLEALARAYELEVGPANALLGKTPRLWLSAGLGLEWRLL